MESLSLMDVQITTKKLMIFAQKVIHLSSSFCILAKFLYSFQLGVQLDPLVWTNKQQEAFIIRQASDHVGASSGHARNSSSIGGGSSGARFFRDLGGASSPGLPTSRMDLAPGKLVEGLGLDARRYIENLLSLNR